MTLEYTEHMNIFEDNDTKAMVSVGNEDFNSIEKFQRTEKNSNHKILGHCY